VTERIISVRLRWIGRVEVNHLISAGGRNTCGDTFDKVAMRIDESKAIAALQILERHSLDQCRLASASFPDDVDVGKAILVFYAEQAIIIAKVDPAQM
jgi:hypothetical protein